MSPSPLAPAPGPVWGLGATVGFFLLIAGVFVGLQTAAFRWFAELAAIDATQTAAELARNGLLLALATVLSAPACIALTVLAAWARRGARVLDYLAVRAVGGGELARWVALAAALMLAADLMMWALGRALVPDFMRASYATMGVPVLYWFAVVVLAPISEELVFRGFLFAGLARSRLGPRVAVVVTALAWAGVHTQYDALEMAVVWAGGLLLGYARLRSDSTSVPIVLHALWNAVAIIEVALLG